MNFRQIFLIVLAGFLGCTNASPNTINIEFGHLTSQNGLSNSDINSIVQDKDGFIWFATEYGLNRYDGYELKIYRNITGDKTSLTDNSINCIFVDHNGTLWAGTSRGGLCRYVKNSDSFISYLHDPTNPRSITFNYITSIVEDEFNNMWVSTLEGLNKYNASTDDFLQVIYKKGNFGAIDSQEYAVDFYTNGREMLKDVNFRSITADKKGNLWIGTERNGLLLLDLNTKVFHHFPFSANALKVSNDNAINNILRIKDELWLATRFSGIIIFNTINKSFKSLELKSADPRTTCLVNENQNNIWIGTKNGLYAYNLKTKEEKSFFHQDCNYYSISNNSISCLYLDRQGILWAGCLQGGVNYTINQKGFLTYKKELCKTLTLSQQSVSAIMTDSRNNLWIGYFDNGIDIINKTTGQKKYYYDIPTDNGKINTGTIFCFFEDHKGRIWIGCYSNGLFMYDPNSGRFKNFKHNELDPTSISKNDIRSICEDSENQLWLAVHGKGISRFNPETGKCSHINYPTNNFGIDPASNWVYKVYFDKEKNLWVTSVTGVSYSSNLGKTFSNYRHNPNSLNSESLDVIWTLHDDGKQLWMGSNMGLSIFDKQSKKFTLVISKNDGLPSDAIAGILSDNHNQLWISTYSGLVKINPNDLKQIKTYNQTDGLQGDQFFSNACFKDKDGQMYFGGPNGLTIFNPDSIKEYKFIPPVFITDFKLFNKSENYPGSKILSKNISQTKEITLEYSENVITFNFVALNFVEPEKNQYAYKLEGFEKDWNISVNKREATYTNLSPGTYTFRVKASNNDGSWNNEGASIKINILPPFWLTIWAFIIYIIIIVFALILYKRNIENRENLKRKLALEQMEAAKQVEMNNVRLKFFTNISHEFRTSLSLIIGPADKLMKDNKTFNLEQSEQISLIRNNAQRLLRLINQLLDLRKIETGNLKLYPSPGDLIVFCKEIGQTFLYLAKDKNIEFTINSNINHLYAWFDADKIEKIIYNLLSNAFKFTNKGGKISMQIKVLENELRERDWIEIKISDNGIGIPSESVDKIFDKFYQVNRTGLETKEGTGIGLSLVKELIDLHSGSITVNSNYSSIPLGTTFTIRLPLDIRGNIDIPSEPYSSPALEDEIIQERAPEYENKRTEMSTILIIEDNSELRQFISNSLKDTYNVIEAENGNQGLKMTFDNNPDLIISDIMMPGVEGTELCRILKSDERTSHIPVLLLTALSSVEHKIEGYNTGADDYITKPFNEDILKSRIRNIIENRRRIRERFSKQILIEPKDITITSADEQFIRRAIDTVEKHMDDSSFDVEVFTKEMAVSRTLLHTKLKSLTDNSATEFIKTIRLKRAAKLLTEGQMGVSEVSIMVGFNSRNYFTKCFTEFFGVSPSDYLKDHKSN